MEKGKFRFHEELAITQQFIEHAELCNKLKLFRASILYCALAIESFWWRIRFGKPKAPTSHVDSEMVMKWLTKIQREGLLTQEDIDVVDAIFVIRYTHIHFGFFSYEEELLRMKTDKRYCNALKKLGLDSAELAGKGQLVASEPIGKAIFLQTEELLQRWVRSLV